MNETKTHLSRRQVLTGIAGGLAYRNIGDISSARAEERPPVPAEHDDIDRMIGSMIIMGFWGRDSSSPGAAAMARWIRSGKIGGVIYFDDNLPSPDAALRFNSLFQDAASRRRLLLCVDQEGGNVARLHSDRGFVALPAAHDVAKLSPSEADRLYTQAAAEMHRLGFNVNFGPVVDLDLNRDSPIIAGLGRSYGADPEQVVGLAKIFIDAHRRNHMLTALKHFPGHGSARGDSHVSLPDVTRTWTETELKPFAELANSGYADMIMAAHLVNANLTEPGRPVSLSNKALTELLRGRLGYDGIIVSDDMHMGAIRQHFSPDESILLGIEAGIDLFIFSNRLHPDPAMPDRFHRVVKAALQSGRIDRARVERSAARLASITAAAPSIVFDTPQQRNRS